MHKLNVYLDNMLFLNSYINNLCLLICFGQKVSNSLVQLSQFVNFQFSLPINKFSGLPTPQKSLNVV